MLSTGKDPKNVKVNVHISLNFDNILEVSID